MKSALVATVIGGKFGKFQIGSLPDCRDLVPIWPQGSCFMRVLPPNTDVFALAVHELGDSF